MDWFVVNARDAQWLDNEKFGAFTRFEPAGEQFEQLGINLSVLQPGQPMCFYHGEANQEGFLVLSGSLVLLIEGEERQLGPWDYVHSPPWTEHVIVASGDSPSIVLAVGARQDEGVVYPVSELALRYGAGAAEERRRGVDGEAGQSPYIGFPDDHESESPL